MLQTKFKSNTCSQVAEWLAASLDGPLPEIGKRSLESHLSVCRTCVEKLHTMRQVQVGLKALPSRVAPPFLTTRLRIAASRELIRRQETASWSGRWKKMHGDVRLWANNLMRPLAIPATGGFFSAMVLFTMLLPGMNVRAFSGVNDIPTCLYTDPSVKSVIPIAFSDDDLVVEVTVDENGRMVDYSIPDCKHVAASPQLCKAVENNLLFSTFTPATNFGQPRLSKVRISFKNSHIDVRG